MLYKLTHFMETLIFIYGGKFHPVHFYITYHHATVPILLWISLNFYPGGHSVFSLFVNLLTHSITFGYLCLMQFMPKLKTLNWQVFTSWVNLMQMLVIFVHGCQLFFSNPCNYPIILVWTAALWGVSIIVAFLLTWPYLNKKRIKELEKFVAKDND